MAHGALTAFVSAGCAQRSPQAAPPEEPTGVDGRGPVYGNYSREEVNRVRVALAGLKFPVAEGTTARLLPRSLEPLNVKFSDWIPDQEKNGRMGGNIVEYWMDHEHVLQIATAYYAQGEKQFSLEEWAVLLTRAEWATYRRAIYPGDWVAVPRE